MAKLQQWAARFDAMSLRERLLLLVTLVVALLLPGFMYVIEPAQIESRTLRTQQQQLQAQNAEARVDYELAKAAQVEDPNLALQQQIDQLRLQSERQAQLLQQRSASLVSPHEMVAMLQQMLKGHQGVRLVAARKAAPVRIDAAADGAEATAQAGLYRHDLELVLEGRFFQVQGFLKAVETANKSLFWDSLDYQVEQYPSARVTLQVYTLSTTQEWLGV